MKERKTIKHKQYTIDEKNEIVSMYLNGQTSGIRQIAKDLNLDHSYIVIWRKQYKTYDTTIDNRGKATKKENPNKGRPKTNNDLEKMTKDELIEHIRMLEDIKKLWLT